MRLKLHSMLLVPFICLAGASCFQAVAQQKGPDAISSLYTNTGGKSCRTTFYDRQSASITQICQGVAGYRLEVSEGDLRMTVTIISPSGKKSELNYWNVITSGFSSLGEKAEWRVKRVAGKVVPIALIVRVNASEHPESPEKTTSYLAVAKITPQKSCVTDKIGPGAGANEQARRAADSAANKPCLEDGRPE